MALSDILSELGHTEAKRGRKSGDVDPRTTARFAKLDAIAEAIAPRDDGVRVLMNGDELGTLTVGDVGCEDAPTMLAPTVKAWAKARGYEVAPKTCEGGIRFIVAGVPVPDKPARKQAK